MAGSSAKRKASSINSKPESKDPVHSPTVHKHPRLEPSTDGEADAWRPLKFVHGASLDFKIICAIDILANKSTNDIFAQIANIYDADSVLWEARETVENQQTSVALRTELHELDRVIAIAKLRPDLFKNVKDKLSAYSNQPVWKLSSFTLQEWYNDALTFIHNCMSLSDTYTIEPILREAQTKVEKTYRQLLQIVDTDIPEISYHTGDTTHNIPNYVREINMQLNMICDQEQHDRTTVAPMFGTICKMYENMCIAAQDPEFGKSNSYPFEDLANACRMIGKALVHYLHAFESDANLKDRHLHRRIDILCQGWRHTFISSTESRIRQLLTERFQALQKLVDSRSEQCLEANFTTVARDLFAFAHTAPLGINEDEWVRYAPRMFSAEQTSNFMNKLQCLHTSFQNFFYNKSERSRLWLSIWRGLKTTYTILREKDFNQDMPTFPVEVEFFSRDTVRNQFELVLSGPEALYPEVVENIVGEYCIDIEGCRNTVEVKYDPLRIINGTNEAQNCTLAKINSYVHGREWSDFALRGIEKCALRLNHILAGPAFCRRIDHHNRRTSIGWKIEKVSMPLVFPQPKPGQDNNTVTTQDRLLKSELPSQGDKFSKSAFDQNIDFPGGMYVISAEDYVIYPFPETRALEVAQSRQISREMSQAGIESPGALVEDVINLPKRHTWPPGTISVWARYLPTDPVKILTAVWSEWRNPTSSKTIAQAKPHPYITPRRPRKEWVDQHPRLRPLYDMKRRVTKPSGRIRCISDSGSALRRPSHIGAIPRLRGDGSQPANCLLHQPEVNMLSSRDQPDSFEMTALTDQLTNRIQGFWRSGDVPPIRILREVFLIPNHWDVDRAYVAVQRFVNDGILETSSQTTKPDWYDEYRALQSQLPEQRSTYPNMTKVPYVEEEEEEEEALGQNADISNHQVVPPPSRRPARANILGSPIQQRRPMPLGELSLVPLLGSHMATVQTDDPGQNANIAVDPFSKDGLPDAVTVWQDASGQPVAAATSFSEIPAGNQEHQARRERERMGLPPRAPSDNNSNQENVAPTISFRSTQEIAQAPAGLICDPHRCHPCPHYTGLFHHICQSAAQPVAQQTTRPLAQVEPKPRELKEGTKFNSFRAERNPARRGQREVNLTPTNVAGHNLRNRATLAQQRAEREARDAFFDDSETALTPRATTTTTAADLVQVANQATAAIQDSVAAAVSNLNSSNISNTSTHSSSILNPSSNTSVSSLDLLNVVAAHVQAQIVANGGASNHGSETSESDADTDADVDSAVEESSSSSSDESSDPPASPSKRGTGRGRARARGAPSPSPHLVTTPSGRGRGRGARAASAANTSTPAARRGSSRGRGRAWRARRGTARGRGAASTAPVPDPPTRGRGRPRGSTRARGESSSQP